MVSCWLILAGMLALAASLPAQQQVTGTRVTDVMRGTVNFKQAAALANKPGVIKQATAGVSGAPMSKAALEEALSAKAASKAGTLPSLPPAGSFQALDDNGTVVPPDTMGAVGPRHLMVTLNSEVRIQDRAGVEISRVPLNLFWLSVGNPTCSYPRCYYDPSTNRWIFVALADRNLPTSGILVGVSQTDDPTGTWSLYRVAADPLYSFVWADYPNAGFNKDWIVVTANIYESFYYYYGTYFLWQNIFVFSKADLYAGGMGIPTLLTAYSFNGSGFSMVPAVTYDQNLDQLFLMEVNNLNPNYNTGVSSQLRLSSISGPVGFETLTVGIGLTPASITWASAEPLAFTVNGGCLPQKGTPNGIAATDCRLNNVVYRNGSLWCSHHIFLPPSNPTNTHTAAQWWQVGTNGAVIQRGLVEDQSGAVSYAYPSIAVNSSNDVFIGFSRFSTNEYASAGYVTRMGYDLPNTLRGEGLLKPGEASYVKTVGGFVNRWGEYSASMVDPVNDQDFWTIQEYAALPSGASDLWGTWWGHLVLGNLTQFAYPTNTVLEGAAPGFASITVLNFGGAAGTIHYSTSDGTALAGIDYLPSDGVLNFAPGQLVTNFEVIILDNAIVDGNRTINLLLSDPTGDLVLGSLSNSVLTIIDDESIQPPSTAGEFNFSSYLDHSLYYEVTENETDFAESVLGPPRQRSALGALITVVRTNGSTGRVLVDYSTVPVGSARANIDYVPTNGTLVFDDYQMSTNFLVKIISQPLTIVLGIFTNYLDLPMPYRYFSVKLSNPRADPLEEAQNPGLIRPTLGPGASSDVYIYSVNQGTLPISYYYTNSLYYTNLYYYFGTTIGINSFAWERRWYRMDEYPGRDPRLPGGYNVLRMSILLLPVGGPGTVRVVYPGYLRTDTGLMGPGGILGGGSWLAAGSDIAIHEETGGIMWPNPNITTNGPLSQITDPWDFLWPHDQNMPVNAHDVSFGPGQWRADVDLLVATNDSTVEFNEDVILQLRALGGNPPVNPYSQICNVTILYDDQPAGALDREWNVDDVEGTVPNYNKTPGANNSVAAVAVQPDGKTVLVGDFTSVNAQARNRVARFNFDGSLDTLFVPGTGADAQVSCVAVYGTNDVVNSGKTLVAGGFSSFNGSQRNGIARLLPNGQLDPTFFPGGGTDGPVQAMALQADGKVVIAGNFSQYNYVPRYGIARINPDGSLDTTFNMGDGPDGTIWSLAKTSTGPGTPEKLLIGGDFLFIGTNYYGGIAQLAIDGTLDPSFNPGFSADGPIYAVAAQNNGMVLIAGAFYGYNFVSRPTIARLFPDGTLDTSFDPGAGADNPIFALTLWTNNQAFIGGPFTSFNGTRRMGLARLRLDGSLDTSFMDTGYNQFAGLPKTLSFEPPSFIKSIALQPDGNLMVGGSFTNVGGNPSYAKNVANQHTVFTRADKRPRYNVARILNGVTPGPGNVEFDQQNYYVDENVGSAQVQLQRTDGRLGTLQATAQTMDRTATNMVDYRSTNLLSIWPQTFFMTNIPVNMVEFGLVFPTNWAPPSVGGTLPHYLDVPIMDNTLQDGDRMLDLGFLHPGGSLLLGGEYIPLGGALGKTKASITIADNDFPAGTFGFSAPTFFINETNGYATITVMRTNGSSGSVSVQCFTTSATASPVATPNVDYVPVNGLTLFFASGQTNATFRVPVLHTPSVDFDKNVGLILTNATGGAKLPGGRPTSITTATLVIVDTDYPSGRLNFALSSFVTNENAGAAVITVTRTGGNSGAISTKFYAVSNSIGVVSAGTNPATIGADFSITNGILNWNDGESVSKTFNVPLWSDGKVDGTKTVLLYLTNAYRQLTPDSKLFGVRSNATLYITDDDACGSFVFNQSFYQADERGGVATITVVRQAGIAETVMLDVSIYPVDPTSPGFNYLPPVSTNYTPWVTNMVTLTFLPGEISKTFNITILQDGQADGDKDLILTLLNPRASRPVAVSPSLGSPSSTKLTIIDSESYNNPAGDLDVTFNPLAKTDGPVYAIALQQDGNLLLAGDFTKLNEIPRNKLGRLLANGNFDPSFDVGPGADGAIRSMILQPDGRVLIGGSFSQIVGTNRNGIARLYFDGTLDTTFNPGSGADNPIFALAVQPDDRKVLVGGAFNKFNSLVHPSLVRLNTNGSVDLTFATNMLDGTVYAIGLQADGKVLIGGDFTHINGTNRTRLARLNRNGSLDLSFTNVVVNDSVRAILVQPDGKIVVGGSFTNINGVTRNYLGRLNMDGSLDTTFLSQALSANAVGANGSVYTLALQVDNKILVGGDFTSFNKVTRKCLTRLRADGTTDPSINFGNGANGFIAALAIQPDRNIVFGGGFTTFNDQPRPHIARIYGGAIAGVGEIEFASAVYTANEVDTNVVITVRRVGGTFTNVSADYFTGDLLDTALPGVDYLSASGTLGFIEGETRQSFSVVLPSDTRSQLEGDRFFTVTLTNFVDVTHTATNGPQPYAKVFIQDKEDQLGFSLAFYSVNKNDPGGAATISVIRQGNMNCTNTVDFATVDGGTAIPALNYWPTNGTLTFAPGQSNLSFNVPIINNNLMEGLRTISLVLSNPTSSVVSNPAPAVNVWLSNYTATLNIVDNRFAGGQIIFVPTNYTVNEYPPVSGGQRYAELILIRTNGSSGLVSFHYSTFDITATSGINYSGTNNVRLSFNDGETVKSIYIPILEDGHADPDLVFGVTIFGAESPIILGPETNAFVTIVDDSTSPYVKFIQTNFVASEGDTNALITVVRGAPPTNAISVSYRTSDATAQAGLHYAATSGQLNWAVNDDTPKTFLVPLIRDYRIGPQVFANLTLFNPINCSIRMSNATLTIVDVDLPAGGVDPAFARNYWANSNVYAVAFDVSAHLYAGGDFTFMHGLAQNHLARLTTNGVVDTAFDMGAGFDSAVYALAPYGTNWLAVGGNFTNYDGHYLGRVALLQPDGQRVPTFNPTNGADAPVRALAWSSASSILSFTNSSLTSSTNNSTNSILVTFNQGTISANFTFFPPASNANLGTNAIPYTNTFQILFGAGQIYITNIVVDTNVVSGSVANLPFGPGTATNITIVVNGGLTNGTAWDYAGILVMGGLGNKLVLGGEFTHVNGQLLSHIARLNIDGTLDGTFSIGSGANSNVFAVASYSTNQLLVGGMFTRMNGLTNINLSRLNANGSVDATFKAGPGLCPDAAVRSISPQLDGRIIIAGDFLSVGGVPRGHVARLNADGSVDLTFNPGLGADGTVYASAVQADGNIVLVGDFASFDGNVFNHIVRLMPDGSVDPAFNPGQGANDSIYAVALGGAVQPGLASQGRKLSTPKIVGGRPATVNQFPYQVALINNPYDPNNLYPNQFCGGSILNNRWILTAAHCMFRGAMGAKVPVLPSDFAVVVGVSDLTQPAGSQVFMVDQFFVHPGYQPNANPLSGNDVALVHVTMDISFAGPYVAAPVALITPTEAGLGQTAPGTVGTVTGWGNTGGVTGGASYPNQLQVASMPLTASTGCWPLAWITPTMITAGYPAANITPCDGDSGGPFVITNTAGVIKEIGVVSWGANPCITPGCPAVFARVSALYDWISGIAGLNQATSPLAVTGDKIAIGGLFTQFNSLVRPRLAVLDDSGSISAMYDPTVAADVAVYSVAVYTNSLQPFLFGKVVAGGDYGSIVGVLENRLARLNANGTIDTNFDIGLGPDQAINSVVLQPDGKVIVGGFFTSFNGITRNYLARLLPNGQLDDSFNVGVGLDNGINAMVLQADGQLLIGGMFGTVYGTSRNGIARVTTNGAVDTAFSPGTGANIGLVNAIALQTNGLILVGGTFSSFNSVTNSGRVVRLLTNGAVDATFRSPLNNGSVSAVAVQADGKVLIGGVFTVVANGRTSYNVARLNTDGSVDATFNTGLGANDFVSSLGVQPDGRLLVVGGFTLFDGQFRNRILRLNNDGSTDPTINFGLGANSFISTELLQNFDGNILVGGAFSQFDTEVRLGIARLLNGTNTDPGMIQFSAPVYSFLENAGSAVVTVVREGGLNGVARVNYVTSDGTAVSTGSSPDYRQAGGTLIFTNGEAIKTISIGLVDNFVTNGPRAFSVRLFAPVGDGIAGHPQPILGSPTAATVNIMDDESVIGFSAAQYTVMEDAGTARITVRRVGGTSLKATVECFTVNSGPARGTAVPTNDYSPAYAQLVFDPGVTVQNFFIKIINNPSIDLPKTVTLLLSNLSGPVLMGVGTATLTIIDDQRGPGVLSFTTNSYSVVKDQGQVLISVMRSNGYSGTVSTRFATGNNGTARPYLDYVPTNGVIFFADGETNKSFSVAIVDDHSGIVEGTKTVDLELFGTTGGATIGTSNATLQILDNQGYGTFSFGAPVYTVTEGASAAVINVIRSVGHASTVGVTFQTQDSDTATAGIDYTAVSSVLTFLPGQTNQSITIPILDDHNVMGTKTVSLLLSNAIGGADIGQPNPATLWIYDREIAFTLSQTNYYISETSRVATITVVRYGNTNVAASVVASASREPGTPGIQFVATNVVLNFLPGETNKPFNVIVLYSPLATGDTYANLSLSSASGGGLTTPYPAGRLYIQDVDTAVCFSSAVYTVWEGVTNATITVIRTGATNNSVSVNYSALPITALDGVNFISIPSGTLIMAPGVSSTNFTVTILDDTNVGPNVTVSLTLSSPANALLCAQSSAVLVILEKDSSVGFSPTSYTVNKAVGSAAITLVRKGLATNSLSVTFLTSNGIGASGAIAGTDYVRSSNVVTWAANDLTPKQVYVPVINNGLVQGVRTVQLMLVNVPTNVMVNPAFATLNIVDNAGYMSFAAVNATCIAGQGAAITLLRTGGSNGVVTVDYQFTGGTAVPGLDLTNTAGTVAFADGETSKTIVVPTIAHTNAVGLKTAQFSLTNATSGAMLGSPAAMTLTILDNRLGVIVPAGSHLVAESGPVNSLIDAGETVTMEFALRNIGVVNTTNLYGILLATNGVAMTNGALTQRQYYGAITAGGASVSARFTFRAVGNVGDQLIATLVFTEGLNGPTNGLAVFSYMLGNNTTPLANGTRIDINDYTNASPYPSVIHVSGVQGTIQKVTVTVSNLTHTYPGDIDLLLVGPNGQQVMLMSDAGSSNNAAVSGVTLRFDDTVTNLPPYRGQIVSGTYHPVNYETSVDPFPTPPAPYAPIKPPYATSFAAFTGTDANGDWLLYIVDDTSLNIGFVANGWSISILTSQAILPAADLSVNLSALPDPVDTSTPFTYTSAVTNHGPDIATNMTLIDSIPLPNTLLRLVTILPPGQGTYEVRATNGVSQVIGHLGSLANGGWAIMSVQVMAPATNSQLVAVATVSGSQIDLNQGDNTSTVTNTVADLPRLKIRIEGGNLIIVWPVTSGNYNLQSTPALNPAVWTNVPQTPVVPPSGPDAGYYKVTLPLSGASQFFRLIAQ